MVYQVKDVVKTLAKIAESLKEVPSFPQGNL